ncbi:fibronectin type III domain-containing protein, partial [Flavobacteriales bacterium]|nr:fibronectin type III domain-containing protein [Flavobacteriales bacterium]
MNSSMVSAQNCDVPVGLNTSSISNFSATLNWDLDANVDHYRLRYKQNGSSSWLYEHNATGVSFDVADLNQISTYIWQAKAFCSTGNSPNSAWSVVDTFITTNYVVDCNNTPNGTAFTDSCGNCVGGTTGDVACIDFTPSVNITLSTTECNVLSDITFVTSQDANEPDISSSIFSSDAGFFNFIGLTSNDVIGSADFIAGGGYINVNTTLMVDFIITSNKISVKAVDNATSQIYGSFTIENASGGILVVATSAPDNNNVTSGNSQIILLNGLFVNPNPTTIIFTSTINSELGDIDYQNSTETIECVDCNGDLGGTAFTDSCGNCVGGNTGDAACIPFTPTVSVSLSNTDCDSLSDLSIIVSQDPNEPDMATSLFASDAGSFAISSMNVNDIIGSATMSVNGGNNTFNTNLIVTTIISANQVVIQSQDVNTGLILGSFTISNLNPGVSISTQSPPDNNNVTSGNAQTVIFNNVFVNSGAGVLTFTTTINSEISDQDVQNFPFTIVCLCTPNSSTDVVVACDSYTWIDGVT